MPSAVLTTHSTLLTCSGWTETSIAGTVAAIGVNRHGQLSICDVAVLPSSEATVGLFLGTRAAFGSFHAETVLIDADGRRWSVASILSAEESQALNWESCLHGGDLMSSQPGMDLLWDAFGATALAGNKEAMVVRSFQAGSVGGEKIVRLNRSQFDRDCIASGFGGAAKWLKALRGIDVDLASADRSVYRLALWLATCQQASGEGYKFTFDSIQHTSAVRVELNAKVGQVEPLRTAFCAGIANQSIVSWTDRSWNPVSSGFIVEGRTL